MYVRYCIYTWLVWDLTVYVWGELTSQKRDLNPLYNDTSTELTIYMYVCRPQSYVSPSHHCKGEGNIYKYYIHKIQCIGYVCMYIQ